MKKGIIIYGKGNFAKLMHYYFQYDTKYSKIYKVEAFCVDKEYLDCDKFLNLPLISFEEIEYKYSPNQYQALVVIGYSNMRTRKLMFDKIKNKGYECVNYISEKAMVSKGVTFGENNIILENVVIQPFVRFHDNNIIWSSSVICHEAKIESHSFIAGQCLIGGFTNIRDNCFLGFNTTVIQNLIIERETLIGAKSLLLHDTDEFSKYIGIPAKKISTHESEGINIKYGNIRVA